MRSYITTSIIFMRIALSSKSTLRYLNPMLHNALHHTLPSLALVRSLKILLRNPPVSPFVPQVRRQIGITHQCLSQRSKTVTDVLSSCVRRIEPWNRAVEVRVTVDELSKHV